MQLADLPSRRTEAWKWSDLRQALADGEDELARVKAQPEASPIAQLAAGLSNERSETQLTIGEKPPEQHLAIQHAWDVPGVVRRIVAPAGTTGVIVESISAPSLAGAKLLAAYTVIDIEEGATLSRVVVQESSPLLDGASSAVVLNEAAVRLAAGATFRQFVLGEGGRLARIETSVSVEGEGATVELNGVYLAGSKRHIDLTSRVEHKVPGVTTRQLMRGAARKGGRGVFQGRFLVERAAQKTAAEMRHNALLLEEGAEVFAKPELEIYADDVQCAHGNTAGQLNEDAIFYLRQRGIPDTEARAMITRAFLIEALPDWLEAGLRGDIEARIDLWLGTTP